jgi:molecular chaperone DnaK
MYQAQGGAQAAGAAPEGGAAPHAAPGGEGQPADDNVVDAEFTEVKDKK